MRKRIDRSAAGVKPRLTDINGYCSYLGVGRNLAMRYADAIGAKVKIGNRTVYDLDITDKALDEKIEVQ